jgi:phosphatidylserine/phosphatidylglycerophosphate/cardiolipin synthase-like enzyme
VSLIRFLITAALLATLSACATTGEPEICPVGTQELPDCPPLGAIADPFIDQLYAERTWVHPDELKIDPIEVGKRAEIPIQHADVKFLGTTAEGALNSLAAKIWMIDNARHTVDATYYIFKRDLVGESLLGALCNAVRRGVDVRFMVDSIGSLDPNHHGLKALETCANDAGFMRNADGQVTTRMARVQVVIFNAISKIFVNMNRRSHDKLLVVDGSFPDRAMAMTGGRNISLAYYGIKSDGSPDPDTYMDAEVLVRTKGPKASDEITVGEVSEAYFTLLFFFQNNHRLRPSRSILARKKYDGLRRTAQTRLSELKAIPVVKERLDAMPEYMARGWTESRVLLAHEFGNLTNRDVFKDPVENLKRNPNSIQYFLSTVAFEDSTHARFVSPYLFAPEFYDSDGNEILDGARNVHRWLEEDPQRTLEIITNSVLTSDNFPAQSVIDMNMAPRMLLPKDWQEAWLNRREDGEKNASLVGSEEWRKLIDHPRLFIYETGRLDDRTIGGDTDYGKLHAKYLIMDDGGFVGTTNFDHRSRLLNNEMGFFLESKELIRQMNADFELLKSRSYRWGSPEWLEMRQRLFQMRGIKANTAKSQRSIYKFLRATGIERQL